MKLRWLIKSDGTVVLQYLIVALPGERCTTVWKDIPVFTEEMAAMWDACNDIVAERLYTDD
jgi:hypothetical protein